MTGSRRAVVALTDGEGNLEVYLDLLEQRGHDVSRSASPYEAAVDLARRGDATLVARLAALPPHAEELLTPLRRTGSGCRVVLCGPGRPGPGLASLADATLEEPFRFSALLAAVGDPEAPAPAPPPAPEPAAPPVAATPPPAAPPEEAAVQPSPALPSTPPTPPSPAPRHGRLHWTAPRLLACARRLSELERDRDQLLSTALEMFLEVGESDRGSIMLRSPEGTHLELVRKSGFPREVGEPDAVRLGQPYAGQVALTGVALAGEAPDPSERPGYRGASFLIVPLMDHRTVLGVVNLTNRRGGGAYAQEDLEVVSFLAQQFAINLVNADTQSELRHMTVVDPLTNLFNRRYFDRQLQIELERARRYDRQVTLALLDIDNFKLINDFNGYVTGDLVLREVAEIIRGSVREVDIVTRWGGDEFAILLPETGKPRQPTPGESQTVNYIERVREAVETEDFQRKVQGLTGRITVSGGVATFPVDSTDSDGLFTLANQALLRAKRAGHNRVCVASGGTSQGEAVHRSG